MLNGVYTFCYIVGLLISSPYWIWRAIKKRELGMTRARLGFTPWPVSGTHGHSLWIHAVSVGEVQAAQPLIQAIHQRDSGKKIVLTVTTRTGMEVARKSPAAAPGVAGPLQFPLDLPWAVNRRLSEIQPAAIIFIDTEIWPNLIVSAARRNARLFLANGRISDKSFGRYRLARFYLKSLFDRFTFFWMQSELNAERIIALGAPPDRVRVGGNLKIDAMGMNIKNESAAASAGAPPLFLAASTHAGEEEVILAAAKQWKSQGRAFHLAIAPRHPERAGVVRSLVESFGFHPVLQSVIRNGGNWRWPADTEPSDVLLIDTIGELSLFFPQAGAVFVGGSLVPTGGHNIFEPAAFGRPILYGPHMENFREADEALAGKGAVRLGSSAEFAKAAETLLFDREHADALGKKARETFESLQGAAHRMAAELLEAL